MKPVFSSSGSILVTLGTGRRLPNMSLRILDLGRTACMLMRSAILMVADYCSGKSSSIVLERALVAALERAVVASLIRGDLKELEYVREGARYLPWSSSVIVMR